MRVRSPRPDRRSVASMQQNGECALHHTSRYYNCRGLAVHEGRLVELNRWLTRAVRATVSTTLDTRPEISGTNHSVRSMSRRIGDSKIPGYVSMAHTIEFRSALPLGSSR